MYRQIIIINKHAFQIQTSYLVIANSFERNSHYIL